MAANIILVREYLESLKEDQELDQIFLLLLLGMDHVIVQGPRDSKGQSQYGKDFISMGFDEDGVKKRFYFELKGHADKDITDHVLNKKDGIIESLRASKFTKFEDSSIEGFNELPIKYILVHNGILRTNTRYNFEGFINDEFPNKNFERWDIHKLSELFSTYLFGEFLLTNQKNIALFKKTLVLADSPEYDAADFRKLIDSLLQHTPTVGSREFDKLFASIHLVCYILMHYCDEAGNLVAAKKGIGYCVLKTWSWILQNDFDKTSKVLNDFRKLLQIHHSVLDAYFKRTLPVVCEKEGLYNEGGRFFEKVGYPLRSMDYLGDLVYFMVQRQYYPKYTDAPNEVKKRRLEIRQKELLFHILEQNKGCTRPVLDDHYIPITWTVLFILSSSQLFESDLQKAHAYLVDILDSLVLTKRLRKRFPEMRSNVEALIEFVATDTRPSDYKDSSSILITVVFELFSMIGLDETNYQAFWPEFHNEVNLQLPFPPDPAEYKNQEIDYFLGNTHQQSTVQSTIDLPKTMGELHLRMSNSEPQPSFTPRTDDAGFPFLHMLSSIYYKNDVYPDEWRKLFREAFAENQSAA